MNKKAQQGPVTYVFMMIFFFIFMGIMGGGLFALIGYASATANLTGLEAFIFNNFPMWIILSAVLGTIGFLYWGGR